MIMLGSNNYLGLTADPRVRAGRHRRGRALRHRGHRQPAAERHAPVHRELEDAAGRLGGHRSGPGVHDRLRRQPGPARRRWSGRTTPLSWTRPPTPAWSTGPASPRGRCAPSATTGPTACAGRCGPGGEQPDAGGALVAVDGIYSMEGDRAPLAEIAAAVPDFGARLLVDEAHALGVVGPAGAGTAAAAGRPARPDHGHLLQVAGQLRRFHRRPAGGDRLPADRLPAPDVHRRRGAGGPGRGPGGGPHRPGRGLAPGGGAARAEQLRAGLAAARLPGGRPVESPIVAVQVGDDWEAGLLWQALLDHGVYTNCAIPPAVPRPCCARRSWPPTPRRTSTGPWPASSGPPRVPSPRLVPPYVGRW